MPRAHDSISHLSLIEPDDMVDTPGGGVARVLSVDKMRGEALVEWASGEQAHFRLILLRRRPRKLQ